MYYTNIANEELQKFHGLQISNFTIKLTDLLSSGLFNVEAIATNVYRIIPLFYCKTISTTNPTDIILDNLCIICTKLDTETYLTFISNENEPISEYTNYMDYYTIGDTLTTAEFNGIIDLLRHSVINKENIKISENIVGEYGKYSFDLKGVTILDNGILVTDETIAAQPRVKLTDPIFHGATYTLELSIIHFDGVNILDDNIDDYIVVDTLEIVLEKNKWVDIPIANLEMGYIISFNSIISITHDKPILQGIITELSLTGDKSIIQTSEILDLKVTATDSLGKGIASKTVYFYEKIEPVLTLTGDKSIIQTDDVLNLSAKVKDTDGSIVPDTDVYFYQKFDDIVNDTTEHTLDTSGAVILHELPDFENNWELSADLKPNGNTRFFIGKKDTATTNQNNSIFFGSTGEGVVDYGHRISSNTIFSFYGSLASEWHHAVIKRNGNVLNFYLDTNKSSGPIQASFFNSQGLVLGLVNTSGSISVKNILLNGFLK